MIKRALKEYSNATKIMKFYSRIRSMQPVAQIKISLSNSLKRFLLINLGEAKEKRFQLFEPAGRVLEAPGASLRFIKNRFRTSEKGFGQQAVCA